MQIPDLQVENFVPGSSFISVIGYRINNSLHLARKYTLIFVRAHYLFQLADSFPGAKLVENCKLRGTDNVQRQIYERILAPKRGYSVYHQIYTFKYFATREKILFAARDVHFSVLSGMTSLTNKNVPFSVTTPKRSVILNKLLNGGSS